MRFFTTLAIIMVSVAALPTLDASSAPADIPASTWFLTSDPAPKSFSDTYANAKGMSAAPGGSEPVPNQARGIAGVLFISPEPFSTSHSFGAETWRTEIHGQNLCHGKTFVTMGHVAPGSEHRTVVARAEFQALNCADAHLDIELVPTGPFTVPAGRHLFLDLWYPGAGTAPGVIYTDDLRGRSLLCPPSGDQDCDGLRDEDERSLGTSPTKKDTDGDGYSDEHEARASSDPRDPLSVPAGASPSPPRSSDEAMERAASLLARFLP